MQTPQYNICLDIDLSSYKAFYLTNIQWNLISANWCEKIHPLRLHDKIARGIKEATEIIQELFSKVIYKEHTKICVLSRR